MSERFPPLLFSILCFGIAVLYIPILVLIGYSFNASELVNVWGGFSTTWYTAVSYTHLDVYKRQVRSSRPRNAR